jgi:hypothetical protein
METNPEANPETSTGTQPETNATPNEPASEATNETTTKPVSGVAYGTDAPRKTRTPRRQKAVIDRIEEGKYAVLLIGSKQVERSIPVEQLPQGARAGSWLKVRVTDDGVKDMLVDEEATQAAEARVRSKLEMLRNRPSYFQSLAPSESQNGSIQPLNPSPSESQSPESQGQESQDSESHGSEWQAGSDQQRAQK